MNAIDFEYDSHYLSDFGFIICSFDGSSGVENVSVGSEISFNTVPMRQGRHFGLTSAVYENCIEAEFDIMKDACLSSDIQEISDAEFRHIMRWLNRREFLPFRFIEEDDDFNNRYYDASFNIEKITVDDKLYGVKLKMITNSPFGYGEDIKFIWDADPDSQMIVQDMSDEIGDTFPVLKITMKESGDLYLRNETIGRQTLIKNCTINEVITIDNKHQIVSTDRETHKIYNDFNFIFFKIVNTLDERDNEITASLHCTIELTYSPIIKDGV